MLILASQSPRRRELIAALGRPFIATVTDTDETLPPLPPAEAVRVLACRKAEAGAKGAKAEDYVVGADTLVFYKDEALGKPTDDEDALRMLMLLSGTTHQVITGVAVWHDGVTESAAEITHVTFRKFDEKEARRYVKTGEPRDKAGAYGIQGKGGKLVASFDGHMDNVIGLPVALLASLLDKQEKKDKMKKVIACLEARYPDATCALQYENDPWRLLVMGRLSAQCTDARVNEVAKSLFAAYPTPKAMADADLDALCDAVRSCGLHRTKGKDLKEASALLVEKYGGVLPDTMEDLLTLPGVGRKIANLLLGDIYGKPAVVTDTHFIRICGRLGAYPEEEKNPLKIERIMTPLLPPEKSSDFCHRIVWFGREVCTARSPACAACPLGDICAHNLRKSKA